MEGDIAAALELRPHQHLLAIPGVGPLVAAKILAETHDVRHFHSAAAFAAHAGAAPVPPPAGAPTATAWPAVGSASSTEPSSHRHGPGPLASRSTRLPRPETR
jgi:hypothetical protein